MAVISVIVGSTRQGRFSEKPAQWILQHLPPYGLTTRGAMSTLDWPSWGHQPGR